MSNKTALITGASSGIGKAFAEELAQRNYDLVIIAPIETELELKGLQFSLETKFSIKVTAIVKDLTQENACQEIYAQVKNENITIDLLINNAGFGDYGKFATRPLPKLLNMIQLNISALVELTYLFLQDMNERGQGDIINVSSIAGFQPTPYLSVYGATKAFILFFSEALWAENQDNDINILALCPGATSTNFAKTAEFIPMATINPNDIATPQKVVRRALDALQAKQANVVTGNFSNQIAVNLSRFLPRENVVKIIAQMLGKNK
ncbi:MAG: SDR family oxidoreductase [Cyanobacterium sp. T60_A2020_053]|nr:SDR family oxidoreductase [Cyanobacterium sp. T60_A2020_053]